MKLKLNSVSIQFRLLLLTVFFVLVGLSVVSNYSDTSSLNDGTTQVRVYEFQEVNGGSEPPLDNHNSSKAFIFGLLLACASSLSFKFDRLENIVLNRRFLNQVRSRSPPSYPL